MGSPTEGLSERLIFTRAEDGLPLEGVFISSARREPAGQAVVWIHGGASKFYEPHYVAAGRELAARGYPCVLGNTRGHDASTLIWRGDEVMVAGGSFERFDQAPYDLAAWVDFAITQEVESVVLIGHSLGASKVVHYAAERHDARVRAVVAASPMEGRPSNPDRVALAERMVAEGQGDSLLPHLEGTPNWNMISAQTVLTREQVLQHAFDSDTRTPYMAQLECPLLVLYGGSEEIDPGWLDTLKRNTGSHGLEIRHIAGAGHEFVGEETAVAETVVDWLKSVRERGQRR